jgi:hypothetical protein
MYPPPKPSYYPRAIASRGSTVQYAHAVLHRALKQAVRWGLVPRNDCEDVDRPRLRREESIFWIEANFCLTTV